MGDGRRSCLYVRGKYCSAVQGILDDKIPSGIYNVSDENNYSYNDLIYYSNAKWILPIPHCLVKDLLYRKNNNNIFLKKLNKIDFR